jgi:hypothetical protein
LAAALADQNLPIITGTVNPATLKFEGGATDNQPGDSGIASVTLAPYSDNLQIALVDPDPPSGAGSVDIVVSLITPGVNGRGYLRVTDVTGYRRHALIHIDAVDPLCTGASALQRARSTDSPRQSRITIPAASPRPSPSPFIADQRRRRRSHHTASTATSIFP